MTPRPPATSAPPRPALRWVGAIVLVEVALSLALGSYRLGRRPLWLDEGFTAMASGRGVLRAVDVVRNTDSNMPLYTLALSLWRGLGDSIVTMRSISVLGSAATVVAVYLLGARLFDRKTGLVAGLLFAIAPSAVHYSQELRGYSMLLLLTTLGSFFFAMGLGDRRTRWWVAYAVAAAASCYAHLQAVFVIAAQGASLVFLGRQLIPWRKVLAAWTAVIALLVPLALVILSADDNRGFGTPSLGSIPWTLKVVAGGGRFLALVFVGLGVIPGVMAWRAWRRAGPSNEVWQPAFVLTLVVIPILGVLGSAYVVGGNWTPRYLIAVLPAWIVAVSVGLTRIPDPRLAVLALGVIVLLCAARIEPIYSSSPTENWAGAVAAVDRNGMRADGVVFCDAVLRPPFEFYALRRQTDSLPKPLSPSDPWGDGVHQTAATNLAATPPGRARIWVLTRADQSERRGVCDLQESMAGRRLAFDTSFGIVRVQRFDR